MLERLVDPWLRRLLHPPLPSPRPLPRDLAARAQDVVIAGGPVPLRAWRLAPPGRRVGSLVVVHGWGGDAGRMAPLVRPALDRGWEALLVDLPGHGRTGPVAAYDVARMVADLERIRPAAGTPAPAILGYSFGGVGAYASAAGGVPWSRVILVAAPSGPLEATRIYLERMGWPGRRMVRHLRPALVRALGVDLERFEGTACLPRIDVPILVVHGDRDEVVPASHGAHLASLARPGMGRLLVAGGASHGGILEDGPTAEAIAEFLAESSMD